MLSTSRKEILVISGLVALVVALVVAMVVVGTKAENAFRADCDARGGVVMTDTDTTVTTVVGSNGQVGTGVASSTDYFCIVNGDIVNIG